MRSLVLITLAALLCAGCATNRSTGVHAHSWNDLAGLLGHSYEADMVEAFVLSHGMKGYSKGNSGSYSSLDHPYSLIFKHGRIERLVLIISRKESNPGPVYSGELPHGLTVNDSPDDVLAKLGKPDRLTFREYMHYDKLGLTVSFYMKSDQMAQVDVHYQDDH